MVTLYTSNTTDVRELSRSVLASDFPDAEIVEEQKAAFTYIAVFTHKFDWDSDDLEYPAIQKLEAQLARAYILEHYGGPEYQNIIESIKADVKSSLEILKDNMPTETDEGDILERTDYKSWVLNHDLPFPSKISSLLRADSAMEGELL